MNNSKPKKNNLVLSYLESLWNKILGESRFEGSFLYNEKKIIIHLKHVLIIIYK